jgi:hypothetical protein
MITYVYDELFQSTARVLVNPVNTVGTMSHEIAETFKQIYPDMFTQYQTLCESDAFNIGQVLLFKTPHKWILNLPIKKHFRAQAKIDYIEAGLQKIASIYAEQHLTSLSIPMLGAQDGLDWAEQVQPLMSAYLGTLPIMVYIHLTDENPLLDSKPNISTLNKWLNGTPQDVSFEVFWRNVASLARRHPELTTLDDHKRIFRVKAQEKSATIKYNHLKIAPDDNEELFMPETMLYDLWQYILMAGYVLPQNLPAGLDAYGAELVALLTRLAYIRPVYLAPSDGKKVVGLHYVPPTGSATRIPSNP